MIDEAISRGHEVDIITPTDIQMVMLGPMNYDLFVINSVLNFNMFLDNIINSGIPYITYNHDFNFCLYRNADCKKYKCNRCSWKCNPAKDWFEAMFKKSKLNIFLSPLHLRMTRNIFPDIPRTEIIPAPIDLKKFKNYGKNRKQDHIYFGNIYNGKGIKKMFKDFEGESVHYCGALWDPKMEKLITQAGHLYIGRQNYESMPKLLNHYKSFIRYTQLKESFGRSTIEAIACGCKVIRGGPMIGVDSFDCTDQELLKLCHKAPKTFWDKAEKIAKKDNLNLLVLVGSGLGNIIQTTPMINGLKNLGHNVSVAMWSSMPNVNEVFEDWDAVDKVFINGVNKIKGDFDYVVETVHARAHQFKGLKKYDVLSTKFSPYENGKNDVERNCEVFKHFTDRTILSLPEAYCNYNKKYKLRAKKYIAIANGSNGLEKWQRKKWPYYDQLLELMPDYTFVLLGKEGEGLKRAHDNLIDMTGQLDLRDTLAVIKGADLFIGNDSGLSHCAGALGVKTLVIFGFTDIAKNMPYGKSVNIMRRDIPCSPCQYNEKKWLGCKDWKCINKIFPLTVKNMAIKILKNKPNIKFTTNDMIEEICKGNKFATKFFKKKKFGKKGVIKVCWLQHLQRLGGAELSNLQVIKKASKEFDIVPVTQHTFHEDILKDCDVIIVNNIWRFLPDQLVKLREVFNSAKFLINYSHDHEAILDRDWNFVDYPTEKVEIMNEIFSNSILDVFISPFHHKNYATWFHLNNPVCLPLAIDVDKFLCTKKTKRDTTICLVTGGIIPKDIISYGEFYRGKNVEIYSDYVGDKYKCYPNIKLMPSIHHSKIPDLLKRSKEIIFRPDVIHSGGRVLLEGYLSGCKVIYNDNVGHGSWDVDWNKLDPKTIKWLRDAPKEFWKEVKSAIFKNIKGKK